MDASARIPSDNTMKNIKTVSACLPIPNRFDRLNRRGGMLTLDIVMRVLLKFESLFTFSGLATLITLNC